jgi:hypothetical protein
MTDHRRPSFDDDNTIVESVAPQERRRMSAFKKGIILAITGAIVAGSLSTIAFPQGAVTLVNIILGGGGGVVSSSNPLPISGSFSATLSGFPGSTQTTGTPIAVTTGGVTGTLPAGTVVVASNVGATNNAFCKLGASATVNDQLIAPNSWFGFTVGSNTQLTCITSTSTTTINMVGGAGLPTGAGGGGGGGGSGGTVTQGPTGTNAAAWWTQIGDTTNGPVAVATVGADAVSNTQNGLSSYSRLQLYNGTTWDRWRGINGAANIAGTGTAGTPAGGILTIQGAASMTKLLVTPDSVALPANQSVNVSQVNGVTTLTGTGAQGAGSQRVTVATDTATIAGSAPGTAGTASTNVLTVQGIAAMTPFLTNPGTAANWGVGTSTQNSATVANGILALAQFNTTPTTITSGNMSPFQLDSAGNLLVNVKVGGGTGGTSSSFGSAFPATGTAVGMSQGGNMVAFTGTTGNLNVQCANCSGSGVSTIDEAGFTAGTSLFAGTGGFFQTTATNNALTTGQQGMFQVTANRALFTNLRNAAGTEIGTSTTPLVSTARVVGNAGAIMDAAGQNVAAPANWLQAGCQFNTSPTTITSGNASACQMDSAGNILVNVKSATGITPGTAVGTLTGSAIQGEVTTATPTDYTSGTYDNVSLTTDGGLRTSPTAPAVTTIQTAAVANGNGTNLNMQGYTSAVLNVLCSVACSGGTTINFEASVDNTTFVAIQGINVGTNTVATTTTTSGDWVFNASGYSFLRARISAYSAGTISVKAYQITSPGLPPVTNANIVSSTVSNQTTNLTQLNSVALGSPSNYGTSPGAVSVLGVNAFITGGNLTQFGGTNLSTGTGAGGAGIPRVTISNDSSLAANQSVNVAQFGGVSTSTGQVAVNTAPVTATNTALVVDLRPDSPGIITLGPAADTSSVPEVLSPTSSSTSALSHASVTALGNSLVVKASAGNLYAFNCTAIAGAAAGNCIAVNAASVPATGALTGSTVLDSCNFDTTTKGCSLSRIPMGVNYSTGIVILVSSAASPFTYTTGTDTAFISADYK